MRCSKCGYISFDHLDSCRKCHKPMAVTEMKGTTCFAVVPLFLDPSQGAKVSRVEQDMVDLLDPDLDLLADGDEVIDFGDTMVDSQNVVMDTEAPASERGEITLSDDFEIAFADNSKEAATLALDEEDLLIDTSRFEDVPINVQGVQATQSVQLKIPEGLADISDLARPSVVGGLSSAAGGEVKGGLDVDLEFDDVKLDDLNLSLGGQKIRDSASSIEDDFAALSLDDIDLSGGLEVVPPQSSSRSEDDDLDFDLDLGPLDKVGSGTPKKSSDDLPDFTLSLE